MQPIEATSVLQLGAQHGFNALLVVVLLVGLWRVLTMHREEREADRKAHLEAMNAIVAKLELVLLAVRELQPRVRRGG